MECRILLAVVVVVAAVAAVAVNGAEDVIKFKIDTLNHPILAGSKTLKSQTRTPILKNYVFKNCGNPKTDLAQVGDIVLGPDPVVFPGTLTVSFAVNITKMVDAPLKVRLGLES
ncbi:hypothetical protein EGW08_019263 [Elysia chlorotica]|uniref:MD-2-related lipid-recognition domain-containing protein n=1 Tax=Elysia chlorotica TaxID=188477 RepID=A0A3S1B1W1_ELYCH|nr:hypothetical protein EGW08_019263 [Elysia chlorotica]